MKFSVPYRAFVLVADGRHASLYRNVSDTGITLESTGPFPLKADEEQGGLQLYLGRERNQKVEAEFVKNISDSLYTMAQRNIFESLVLVASPHILGQLRTILPRGVTKRVTGELAKTLTHTSVSNIEISLNLALS